MTVQVKLSSFLPELVSGRGTARRSRVVEGEPRPRFGNDQGQGRRKVIQNRACRNAQGRNARTCEPTISRVIPVRVVTHAVDHAIHLNGKPRIGAIEIQNIRATRVLAAEFQSAGPFAQLTPEQDFRQRHFAPQLSRPADTASARFRRNVFEHRFPPSVSLREPPPRDELGEEWVSGIRMGIGS